jgi:hypothetical protein
MKMIICDVEDWERETFKRLDEHQELTLTSGSLTDENAAEYANVVEMEQAARA